jgi:hypothetical protein
MPLRRPVSPAGDAQPSASAGATCPVRGQLETPAASSRDRRHPAAIGAKWTAGEHRSEDGDMRVRPAVGKAPVLQPPSPVAARQGRPAPLMSVAAIPKLPGTPAPAAMPVPRTGVSVTRERTREIRSSLAAVAPPAIASAQTSSVSKAPPLPTASRPNLRVWQIAAAPPPVPAPTGSPRTAATETIGPAPTPAQALVGTHAFGSVSTLPSAAPPPSSQARGPVTGDVYLDGSKLGRWIADRLAREIARPQSGMTGFDPRLGIAWPGAPLGR